MRIVLSRKGFDSEYGGCPSPILPDGTLISLPIPIKDDERRYGDLRCEDGRSVHEATRGLKLFNPKDRCHLDPDLSEFTVPRKRGWKPSLGQLGSPQSHLQTQGIGIGDLFLFFGWFRRTEVFEGKLRFVRGKGQDLHVIFGWLQVGEILKLQGEVAVPEWLDDHPHTLARRKTVKTNTVYLAADRLSFRADTPGGGTFKFDEKLVLTSPGLTRTRWRIEPEIFKPLKITFHKPTSWKDGYFQSAAKGQEFVIEKGDKVTEWAKSLFET